MSGHDMPSGPGTSFTGLQRSRKTRLPVRLAEIAARAFITLGGLGTIAAVLLVCVFLVWVAVPLFLPESMHLIEDVALESNGAGQPIHVAVDDYLTLGWAALDDGSLRTYRIDTGELLENRELFPGKKLAAWSFALREGHVAFAFDDRSVQFGKIDFVSSFVAPEQVPVELQELSSGEVAAFQNGVLEKTPTGQFRLQELQVDLQDPVAIKSESPIILIDQTVSSSKGTIFAVLTADGMLHMARATEKKNLLTGKVTTWLQEGTLEVKLPSDGKLPEYILLDGLGDSVFLVWNDGRLVRFDTRKTTQPVLAERLDLIEEPDGRITSLDFLIGKSSLVAGDSLGRVRVWFRIKPPDSVAPDGSQLVLGHELPAGPAAVVALAPSPRSRMLAVGFADGQVRLFHVTSEQTLADAKLPDGQEPAMGLSVAPKDNALLAVAGDKLTLWSLDAPHPETTLGTIFRPVWYEGYDKPEHVWQSSSGTDDFEQKFGLIPLVFGTLKGTLYAMLFGVPLALLAAVYTSEFMPSRVRARVKPTIEIMAGLPSVVLGFLAALVIAPLVEDVVPECLTAIAAVPFAFLLAAHLWQLLPPTLAVQVRWLRLVAMFLALPLGLWFAAVIGPIVERWLFAGDIKAWLDGQIGTGTGAWMILFLPVVSLVVAWGFSRFVTPWMRRTCGHLPHSQYALLTLVRFILGCATTIVVLYVVSAGLVLSGWDARGSFVGTYVQRNALVVGFIMGFAIIPIVYTLADDALKSVPDALRAASLGAGATRWQTAIRVVVPTATSGLFSAVMVGLGRAVGETMIMLMATGNTPVMEWNVFNGFRTLSATVAVELPEAVSGSTHFRMLFLAALLLFALTFVINTVAEVVRLRFRKRAFQL